MKKILILALSLVLVLSFAGCTVRTEKYTDEEGNVKEFTYVTRETSDKFTGFENALTEKGIVFETEKKADGIIEGAKEGRRYTLDSGKTFEIFRFDVKSDAYKEAAKTSKLYMESFDVYIDAAINDEYALIPGNDDEMREIFLVLE